MTAAGSFNHMYIYIIRVQRLRIRHFSAPAAAEVVVSVDCRLSAEKGLINKSEWRKGLANVKYMIVFSSFR